MFFAEKVVLVTGGSAGLGVHVAAAFGEHRARVIIVARDAQRLESQASKMRSRGVDVTAIAADVTQQDQVHALLAQIRDRFGRLDVLVNNVGSSARGTACETGPEQFQHLFELNFLTVVRCTRAALPMLLKARGQVVNIGSLSSKMATRFMGAYPVSKFAVAAYSQQLRLELAERGVHVLLVCPGPLARDDAGRRYDDEAGNVPDSARRPGAGARLRLIRPERLAAEIVRACHGRKAELVVPAKARWLSAVSQLWPSLGDRILRRVT